MREPSQRAPQAPTLSRRCSSHTPPAKHLSCSLPQWLYSHCYLTLTHFLLPPLDWNPPILQGLPQALLPPNPRRAPSVTRNLVPELTVHPSTHLALPCFWVTCQMKDLRSYREVESTLLNFKSASYTATTSTKLKAEAKWNIPTFHMRSFLEYYRQRAKRAVSFLLLTCILKSFKFCKETDTSNSKFKVCLLT